MVQGQRRVEHRDVMVGTGLQVDLVVTGSRPANHDKIPSALSERAPFDPGTKHDQAIDSLDMVGLNLEGVEPGPVRMVVFLRPEISEEAEPNMRRSSEP